MVSLIIIVFFQKNIFNLVVCYHERLLYSKPLDSDVSYSSVTSVSTSSTGSAQDIRLVGGRVANEGRVEVFHSGQWQTVCDNGWGLNDADVACRQLGYGHAIRAVTHARFGRGTGGQWEGSILCTGSERRLHDCVFLISLFGIRIRCSHSEDAGVICSTSSECRVSHIRVFNNSTYNT